MVAMTSNTTPPPYVASASSEFPDNKAYRAFDKDNNSLWQGNGPAAYLQLDYGSAGAKLLATYKIGVRSFSNQLFPARNVKDWTIQASDDLITWNIIDTQTNQTGWGSFFGPGPVERTYTCAVATTKYRYFKMVITANNGDPDITAVGKWDMGAQFDHFY